MKKLTSFCLVISLTIGLLSTIVSAETQTITYDSTVTGTSAKVYSDVQVEAERAELYSVTLPKNVVLDVTDTTGTYNYNITVTGEISDGHFVRVIPLENSTIVSELSDTEIPLRVEQAKKRWNYTEVLSGSVANSTNGTFTALNVLPGKYKGVVHYLITLDDGAQWKPATCTTPATRIGVDANDDGVITEDEKDAVVVTHGIALGHNLPNDRDLQCTCSRCESTLFAISTPEHLIEFANNVNSGTAYQNVEINLLEDLDLTGYVIAPIGFYDGTHKMFKGIFNGNNHTIKNYVLNYDINTTTLETYENAPYIGFFGNVQDATIKNITLQAPKIVVNICSDASSIFNAYVGFVIGNSPSGDYIIDNVHVNKGSMQINGDRANKCILRLGGLSSSSSTTHGGSIKNCSVTAEVYAQPTYIYSSYFDTYSNNAVLYNSYAAVKLISNVSFKHVDALNAGGTIYNSFYDNTLMSAQTGTGLSTADCQNQAAIDILNTDNDMIWSLDLEGINNGYPVIK